MKKIREYFVNNYNLIFLILCLMVHIFYTVFFGFLGYRQISFINAFSSVCYLVFMLSIRRYLEVTMLIAYIEIYNYSLLATILLGIESCFYLYVLGMLFASIILFQKSGVIRIVTQCLGIVYLFLCILFEHFKVFGDFFQPNYSDSLEFTLQIINTIITCMTIMFLSFVYLSQQISAREKLEYIASHDELTGLYSRTYFKNLFVDNQRQADSTISVIMLDIDFFKKINDKYGHHVGDIALKYIANCLRQSVRENDSIIRWGGEEFVIILNGCSLENAGNIAEKIRLNVSNGSFYKDGDEEKILTVTLGVSQVLEQEGIEAAIKKADELLYEGKMAGRNRVVVEAPELFEKQLTELGF